MAKPSPTYPKTDSRYWRKKVFKPVVVVDGIRREVPHYSARIQWQGKRQSFPLMSGNIEAAATLAAKIYKRVQVAGWDAALKEFSPSASRAQEKGPVTVGEYLAAVAKVCEVRPRTLADYMRSFRRIVADIEGIQEDVDHDGKAKSRFNYRKNGGRGTWIERVHAVKLHRITPDRVREWKLQYVRRHDGNPLKQQAARNSANSFVRMGRALFAPEVVKGLPKMILPAPLPFEGIKSDPPSDMRYRSTIDPGSLLRAGAVDLATAAPEQWKILLLALGAGLRRSEIDSLLWRQVDFAAGVIRIDTTEVFKPKSEKSAGDVSIDGELAEILKEFHGERSGDFVIEGKSESKPNSSYSHLRAEKQYRELREWLRSKGVSGLKPLHTLRKEFGSMICQSAGLYAASKALRHGDVGITARHYLDSKDRVTIGLAGLLAPPLEKVPVAPPKTSGRRKGSDGQKK